MLRRLLWPFFKKHLGLFISMVFISMLSIGMLACFGSTVFGRKQLSLFPETILIRENRYGISRFKAAPDLIGDMPEVRTE